MEATKILLVFSACFHTITSLTPPPWYYGVGGTWNYIDWCKNEDCTRLLKEHGDNIKDMHSKEELETWSDCRKYLNPMEQAILKHNHTAWNTVDAVHGLMKSPDFCGYQKIEEEWERKNYGGYVEYFHYYTTTTPKPTAHGPPTSPTTPHWDHDHEDHDHHNSIDTTSTRTPVHNVTYGTQEPDHVVHRPCTCPSDAPWITTIVVLVLALIISLAFVGYLGILLRKTQMNFMSNSKCDTLLSEF